MAMYDDENCLNTSIVNTSTIQDGDFDMFLDCLEELYKTKKSAGDKRKSKKSKRAKNAYRRLQLAQSVPALNTNHLFNAFESQENVNVSFATDTSFNSFNDTCTTINTEQLDDIFAYFDQDVSTNELLLSDDSIDEQYLNDEKENIKPSQLTKKDEIQHKTKEILNKIHNYNCTEAKQEIHKKPIIPKNRAFNQISKSSTTKQLQDNNKEFVFKKPVDVVDNGYVREKVAFFSDQSSVQSKLSLPSPSPSSSPSPSPLPSFQSKPIDEQYEFKRSQSIRKFKQNRDFFESFFKSKQDKLEKESLKCNKNIEYKNHNDFVSDDAVDAQEKLTAVRTYVQTQYLLDRIQRLVTSISELDEKRLSSMNLKLLKRFLTFIRDCSYHCTEVCNSISEHFLTDFEKNIMSAEDLLYSALRMAHSTQPPENELQKTHENGTNISEHQLRVQASLQRLNIPDWFKQYNNSSGKTGTDGSASYVPGSFTKKRNADTQRWAGLSSKTTSLSSLGSHRSDRSPLLLSPSAQSHQGHSNFSRWSTSHLNSTQTSPSASTRGSFSRGGPNSSILSNQSYTNNAVRGSFRQPYLGWRSQEKLSQPRTPHERLASSMLSRQQTKQSNALSAKTAAEPVVSPEIQTSIKEVTSAIVHFVNDQNNRTSGNSRSRSTSPSSRKCWLESSFVGNKPMDSPQTPVLDSSIAATPRANGVGESRLL